jgi:hypothetical protein
MPPRGRASLRAARTSPRVTCVMPTSPKGAFWIPSVRWGCFAYLHPCVLLRSCCPVFVTFCGGVWRNLRGIRRLRRCFCRGQRIGAGSRNYRPRSSVIEVLGVEIGPFSWATRERRTVSPRAWEEDSSQGALCRLQAPKNLRRGALRANVGPRTSVLDTVDVTPRQAVLGGDDVGGDASQRLDVRRTALLSGSWSAWWIWKPSGTSPRWVVHTRWCTVR